MGSPETSYGNAGGNRAPPSLNRGETVEPQSPKRSEGGYGWVVVAVSPILLSIGMGSLSSMSVFLVPLTGALGWSRAATTFGYQAGNLSLGLGGVAMGWLADRYPVRRIALFGAAVIGLSYFMLSRQHSLWEFYLYFCLLNGVGGATFYAPLVANAGNWFSEGKGTALGIVTAGQALGQGLIPYVASLLISAYGWREAYFLLGVGSLALALPLVALLRTAPSLQAAWAARSGGPAAEDEGPYPLPCWAVISWLGCAAIFCCITMATPLVHLVALAQDKGIAPDRAARLLLALFVTGVFGRLAYGGLADKLGPLRTYMLASAWQTALVFGFTMLDSLAGLSVYAALWALGYAGVITSLIVCVRSLTPLRQRGLAVGVVSLGGWIGMGLGGVQGGYFFDLRGNYTQAFANAALAGVVNLIVLAALWFTLRRREAALVPAVVS